MGMVLYVYNMILELLMFSDSRARSSIFNVLSDLCNAPMSRLQWVH